MKEGSSVVKAVGLGALALLFLFLGREAPMSLFTQKVEQGIVVEETSEVTEIKDRNDFSGNYKVEQVIDGDTLVVAINGASQNVRVLGIDTPETEFSSRGAECFGAEASEYAKTLLSNTSVELTPDNSQDTFDKYDRLLAYVTLSDGSDFGEVMIAEGYAYENTFKGKWYEKQELYKDTQKVAEEGREGIWGEGVCG